MQLHDILQLRTSVILPEAISDGGLAPTTDTNLFLTTYRGGSHLPSDIQTGCKTTCYCNFTPCFINCYSSHAPFAKRPFGLPRSFATTFAHKKALPSSLYIQLIPHASMIIT